MQSQDLHGFITVSYTHLDVYKRQVVDDILRTGSGQKNTLFHITARLIEGLDNEEKIGRASCRERV